MVFGVVTTKKKLQDDLFCVTEERNYFQSKYLEQVNEIAALKDELRKTKRAIGKLRGELMESSYSSSELLMIGQQPSEKEGVMTNNNNYATPKKNRRTSNTTTTRRQQQQQHDGGFQEEKKDSTAEDENDDDDEEHNDDEEQEEEEEEIDIRQSAEKLLQWASYRSYPRSSSSSIVNSPDQGSVESTTGAPSSATAADSSLLGPMMIPSTIESLSLEDGAASLRQTFSDDSNQHQPQPQQEQQT
jgi:hypothetical protein